LEIKANSFLLVVPLPVGLVPVTIVPAILEVVVLLLLLLLLLLLNLRFVVAQDLLSLV
jgi:hypothetical protein